MADRRRRREEHGEPAVDGRDRVRLQAEPRAQPTPAGRPARPATVGGARVILVAGGTGFIGRATVRRLAADGFDVAVMTAHPDRSVGRIAALGARPVVGDIRDPASIARAVKGMDAVVQTLTFPT